ncbi:MAG: CoA pyrophosphatase [Gemmatimonadetes bacterium]|nr:CoA pyrophosphatase [Gemmatimonadota bacterium]
MDAIAALKERLDRRSPSRVCEPDAWQAAVAVIVVPSAAGAPEMLFIKRAERAGDPWSGQMALPGGRKDDADDTLLGTALRETFEETGIVLPDTALLGELDDLFPNIKVLPSVVVRPFVFGLAERPVVTPNEEVAAHVWLGLDTLRIAGRRTEVEVRGSFRTVEAFVVGGHVIWGMTHRILLPFLDLTA